MCICRSQCLSLAYGLIENPISCFKCPARTLTFCLSFLFHTAPLGVDKLRNSLTGVWSSASPLSFQLAWISSSEISVSKRAVSVSITSTLCRGRTSLISRSRKGKGRHGSSASGRNNPSGFKSRTHGNLLTFDVKLS